MNKLEVLDEKIKIIKVVLESKDKIQTLIDEQQKNSKVLDKRLSKKDDDKSQEAKKK